MVHCLHRELFVQAWCMRYPWALQWNGNLTKIQTLFLYFMYNCYHLKTDTLTVEIVHGCLDLIIMSVALEIIRTLSKKIEQK